MRTYVRTVLTLTLALLLVIPSVATATPYNEQAWQALSIDSREFQVSVPGDWRVTSGDLVSAQSQDSSITIFLGTFPRSQPTDGAFTNIQRSGPDGQSSGHSLSGEPRYEASFNGMEAWFESGTAIMPDGNTYVVIPVAFRHPTSGANGLLLVYLIPDSSQELMDTAAGIISSITAL